MTTDRYTKTMLTLIAICLTTLTLHTLLEPKQTTHAATTTNNNIQFSADKDHLYFYDPSTGKIYTYLVVGGHTQNILQFTEMGNELKSTPLH